MKNNNKYLLPVIGILALLYVIFSPKQKSLQETASVFSNYIIEQEKTFSTVSALLPNTPLSNSALIHLKETQQFPFELILYKNDSLVSYTSNRCIPPNALLLSEQNAMVVPLNNGWYLLQHTKKTGEEIVALTLLKNNFKIENEFLKNTVSFSSNIPSNISITDQKTEGGLPVTDVDGKTIAYIYINSSMPNDNISWYYLFGMLIVLCVLLFYFWQLCDLVSKRINPFVGFFLLGILLVSVRVLMISGELPKDLSLLPIFDPTLYASSYFASSLGQLINSLLFLLVWISFATYIRINSFVQQKHVLLYTVICSISTAFITVVLVWLFKSLILDSIISLELYDVISLSAYSLFALFCVLVYLIIHLQILRISFAVCLTKGTFPVYLICTTITYFIIQYFFCEAKECEVVIFSGIWLFCFILIAKRIHSYARNSIFNWTYSPLLLILYSLVSMFLLENLYETKEREQRLFFGNKLVTGHNYAAEYGFKEISEQLKEDKFLQSYFTSDFIGYRDLKERLSVIYLKKFFQNYDYDVYLYDRNNNTIKSTDSLTEKVLYDRTNRVNKDSLIFLEDSLFQTGYLGVLDVRNDSIHFGKAVFLFKPRLFNTQNVYPELLLNNRFLSVTAQRNYNYAIYNNDKLLIQNGDYPYPYYWDKKIEEEEHDSSKIYFYETRNWEHLVVKENNAKKAIVSIEQEGFFEPLATFSYFFIVLAFITILGWFYYQFFVHKKTLTDQEEIIKMSFQSKIQLAMLSIIIVSFFIIGLVTVSYIHKQYDNYYTERFSRKVKAILTGLEYALQGNETDLKSKADQLRIEAAKQSEINSIDINIFNTSGTLEVSTRPEIFMNGLVSRMMSPIAFDNMTINKENQFIQPEHIGSLSYSSFYVPLRNKSKTTLGYVNIPYFEKSKEVNNEVSSFLVTLLNVYAFLLLCAGILSFFISNSITRPLRFISEKIRRLNLDKRNEPIQWKSNDEIGRLINEYNKMIHALEGSAQQLAKSERETAWRQMARQIAHEIKNPLTPMKLSIQYLQRAIDENNPNVAEMAKKVNRTLIEQIDNLSSIATAFSSFAQMPKPNNEYVDLNIILSDIVHLFENESDAKVLFNSYKENAFVFADKNQLISVFNNLLKNAIQSIPEGREGVVDVIVLEEYGQIKVVVMDNGNGIPPKQYDKVFVPNFTTKSSGTGLGLAISKQIIDNSKGLIWFESEEEVGTTFYVTLPYITQV